MSATLTTKDGSPVTNHENGRWTYQTSEKEVRQVHLGDIASNDPNPRNPAHTCTKLGFGLFSNPVGSEEPETLYQLATSGDKDKMKKYCQVIEEASEIMLRDKESEDDPQAKRKVRKTIVQLAESLAKKGFIHPVRLRPILKGKNSGMYDIVAGARRFMASLYLACKARDLGAFKVTAFVVESTDKESEDLALAENITVDPLSRSEVILAMRSHAERGKSTEWIANLYSTNERTVKRRINAAYAPPAVLAKLDNGRIGIVDVETIGQKCKSGKRNPETVVQEVLARPSRRGNAASGRPALGKPEERKMLSRSVAQSLYEAGKYPNGRELKTAARRFLCKFFGFEWKSVAELANEKAAAAAAKVTEENKPRRGPGRPKGSKNKPKDTAAN